MKISLPKLPKLFRPNRRVDGSQVGSPTNRHVAELKDESLQQLDVAIRRQAANEKKLSEARALRLGFAHDNVRTEMDDRELPQLPLRRTKEG